MKQKIILLFVCIHVFSIKTNAHSDDMGIWSSFNLKYNFSTKIYGSTYLEFRSKENTQRMDCFIARQYLGYIWTSWLKTDAAYDFIRTRSTVHNRFLFSVTATHKEGNFAFTLRERYLYDYNVSSGKGQNILRSKAAISYHIPNTKFSPYVAEELFTWEHWMKTRHYAGTKLKINKHSTFDFFYMYYAKQNKDFQQHLLGVGYILKL